MADLMRDPIAAGLLFVALVLLIAGTVKVFRATAALARLSLLGPWRPCKRWMKCAPATDSYYEIIKDGKAIEFHPCGVVSYHPADIRSGYCGFCHSFVRTEITEA